MTEQIKITFGNEGMEFVVSTSAERYTQAVYALIEQAFERFSELDKLCLLGALCKAISLYEGSNYNILEGGEHDNGNEMLYS